MPSELINVLFKRKNEVEAKGEKWESSPTASSADVKQEKHLEGLVFNAPAVAEWFRELGVMPEEDTVTEAITEGLAERGSRPSHAPPAAVTPEEAANLQNLASVLEKMQKSFLAAQEELGEAREALASREAELRAKEAALEAERQEQQQREEARRNYPQPEWLENVEGTMNIAVTGNSGVGKSLLINKVRRIRPGGGGWASVGVNETTLRPTMYTFPNEPKVRLWDLPGAGTAQFPADTYIQHMGLRYFDSVFIVAAGRFTATEMRLREELEQHKVPYHLVRTKVDIDVWNNKEDNGVEEADTVQQIRDDLLRTHKIPKAYLVSSRDPEKYDFQQLMRDVFPGLRNRLDPTARAFTPSWQQEWAMPVALSPILSGIQGRWYDQYRTVYLVQNSVAHVTTADGRSALYQMREGVEGRIWWFDRWWLDVESVTYARTHQQLRWAPAAPSDLALVWYWAD